MIFKKFMRYLLNVYMYNCVYIYLKYVFILYKDVWMFRNRCVFDGELIFLIIDN